MAAPETRHTRTQQAAVVYNPIKVDLAKLKKAVATTQKAAGWRASLWLPTTEDEIGTAQARQAVEAGVDVVLAAGGDGTVRAVAEGLQGSGVALALLPSGTGNLLARNLDIPVAQLEASIDTAFHGADRPIDVGVIELQRPDGSRETHSFVVLAGLGIDAKMLANTNAELKKRVGWLAYVDAIVRSLRDSEKVRMRYRIDGREERTASVHTVLIGNVGLLPGNLVLLPDAEPDDGLFDIVALRPEGFGGWVQICSRSSGRTASCGAARSGGRSWPRRNRCARCATCGPARSACVSISPKSSSSTATSSAWCAPSRCTSTRHRSSCGLRRPLSELMAARLHRRNGGCREQERQPGRVEDARLLRLARDQASQPVPRIDEHLITVT
jgi:diacylglycerol kinase family enzyme